MSKNTMKQNIQEFFVTLSTLSLTEDVYLNIHDSSLIGFTNDDIFVTELTSKFKKTLGLNNLVSYKLDVRNTEEKKLSIRKLNEGFLWEKDAIKVFKKGTLWFNNDMSGNIAIRLTKLEELKDIKLNFFEIQHFQKVNLEESKVLKKDLSRKAILEDEMIKDIDINNMSEESILLNKEIFNDYLKKYKKMPIRYNFTKNKEKHNIVFDVNVFVYEDSYIVNFGSKLSIKPKREYKAPIDLDKVEKEIEKH